MMKLLKKVRKDAKKFWRNHRYTESWTESLRGCYISGLQYEAAYYEFYHDFMDCKKEDFQRKLHHDYWQLKKTEYYKRYRKKGKKK